MITIINGGTLVGGTVKGWLDHLLYAPLHPITGQV